jgi:predicted DCC family thiol-disulfide oxidoreductase YuxK
MPVLLFCSKTRRSAIYLGFIFHVMLILTLDVPAIFLFLFPAQLLLFIHPKALVDWIERRRSINAASPRFQVIYDGHCQFCKASVRQLQVMDLFGRCDYVDYQVAADLTSLHPALTKDLAASQLHLITPDGRLYGGYFAFRQLAWIMPMLYPLLAFMYLPGADWIGPIKYRFIAQNRYLFHFNRSCKDNRCFR